MTKPYINELDTVHFAVPFAYCKFDSDIDEERSAIGAYYRINSDKIFFNLSGKINATHNDLGKIIQPNYEQTINKIDKLFGIKLDMDYVYERVPLYHADTKKDILTEEHASNYIQHARINIKRKTDKYSIEPYKGTVYEHGFVIKPKAKRKYRFSVYNKGIEIGKSENDDYREIFDYDFSKSLVNVLRCELQLNVFQDMRDFFELGNEQPTFKNIFSSQRDVIYNEFYTLLMEE